MTVYMWSGTVLGLAIVIVYMMVTVSLYCFYRAGGHLSSTGSSVRPCQRSPRWCWVCRCGAWSHQRSFRRRQSSDDLYPLSGHRLGRVGEIYGLPHTLQERTVTRHGQSVRVKLIRKIGDRQSIGFTGNLSLCVGDWRARSYLWFHKMVTNPRLSRVAR